MENRTKSKLKIVDKLLEKLNNSIDIKTHNFLSFQNSLS